jgi:hypothetical protein
MTLEILQGYKQWEEDAHSASHATAAEILQWQGWDDLVTDSSRPQAPAIPRRAEGNSVHFLHMVKRAMEACKETDPSRVRFVFWFDA